MKKILSALISLIMLFSIVSVTPVMADSISGTYTFVDTCYSPELGIYVAVAKDLSSGTTPAQIYVSDNGNDWTLKKTLSQAKHYLCVEIPYFVLVAYRISHRVTWCQTYSF